MMQPTVCSGTTTPPNPRRCCKWSSCEANVHV